LRYGIAAENSSSGGRVRERAVSALARHATRVVAPIETRTAVHTAAALYRNRSGALATLAATAPVHTRAPVVQRAALGASPAFAGVGHGAGHRSWPGEDAA
jgi:hypothetical protein